jgi:hypothetical protein
MAAVTTNYSWNGLTIPNPYLKVLPEGKRSPELVEEGIKTYNTKFYYIVYTDDTKTHTLGSSDGKTKQVASFISSTYPSLSDCYDYLTGSGGLFEGWTKVGD